MAVMLVGLDWIVKESTPLADQVRWFMRNGGIWLVAGVFVVSVGWVAIVMWRRGDGGP